MQVQFGKTFVFLKKPETEVSRANVAADTDYRLIITKPHYGGNNTYSFFSVTEDAVILSTPKEVDENEAMLQKVLMIAAEKIQDDGLSVRNVAKAFREAAGTPGNLPDNLSTTFNDVELDDSQL